MIRMKNILQEEIGLFDTITMYASELPRSKTHEEMMHNAWYEFCKRWSRQNGVKYQGATQLTTQCARHFNIPDRIKRPAAAAHYLRQIGALKLHLGKPTANNGVNEQQDILSIMTTKKRNSAKELNQFLKQAIEFKKMSKKDQAKSRLNALSQKLSANAPDAVKISSLFQDARTIPSTKSDWLQIKSIAEKMRDEMSGLGSGNVLQQLANIKTETQLAALVKNFVYDGQTLYEWLDSEYTISWAQIYNILNKNFDIESATRKYLKQWINPFSMLNAIR